MFRLHFSAGAQKVAGTLPIEPVPRKSARFAMTTTPDPKSEEEIRETRQDPQSEREVSSERMNLGRDGELSEEELAELRREDLHQELGVSPDELGRLTRTKRALADFLYEPRTEIAIFLMIVLSIGLLVFELAIPSQNAMQTSDSWLTGFQGETGWFFWLDVGFSLFFLVEYVLKLWVAPRKWYFVRTHWIDLLAILPILRVFRIGKAVRLLKLFRLLRILRIGRIMHQRASSISSEVQRRSAENMIVVVYLIFSLLFGTIGVLVFEKGTNPGFETLGDGLWWCVVTLTTVGYGDISPQTVGGKVVAAIIMFIGLSFYALLTGLLSSVIIERTRKSEAVGMDIASLQDHVVICGWNETGRRLVEDLLKSDKDPRVVVLYHTSTYPRLLHPHVHYLEEDPTTARGLGLARVKQASVAVVLPELKEGMREQDADARSILTILAVEQLNPGIHTIVELMNEENVYHVKNAGCDEVIVSGAYTGTMLSQAVQFPGVSDVFGDLFSPGKGSHLIDLPLGAEHRGKRFSEVSRSLFLEGKGILVGYRRRGELRLTPGEDEELGAGDRMILLRRG